LKLTEVYTELLKKRVGSTETTVNDITFPTFQLDFVSKATSTAFLLEDENDEDNSVVKNLKENFFYFLDCFGSSICGYSNFNESKKGQNLFSLSCTVSDEAFAILLLRKNWNRWSKKVLKDNLCQGRLGLVQDDASDNQHLSEEYASNKTNKKFRGWTVKAIKEYNELFTNVQSARSTGTRIALEKEYKLHKSSACALIESTTPSEQPSFAGFETLEPRNELNAVAISDSSSSSTNHFSDVSMTQGSQDTIDSLTTNTAAV
jgi:hypothetical protein